MYDDQVLRPQSYGYRLFLGPRISLLIHPEANTLGRPDAEFNLDILVHRIQLSLPRTDWSKAKLILLVMFHKGHYSLFTINKEHSHIHILDALDYKGLQQKFSTTHGHLPRTPKHSTPANQQAWISKLRELEKISLPGYTHN